MHRSKLKQYFLFPLLSILLAAPAMRAQTSTSTDAAPAAQEPAQEPAQTTPAPPAAAGPQSAAARVRARRQQRIQALVKDIYGHKYEAYGGFSYQRFRPGDSLQRSTEVGWNVGLTDYIRPKLGITVDTRGNYGAAYTYNNQYQVFMPSISQYVFMAGPQYRITQGQRLASSVRVLVGVSHGNFDTNTNGLPGTLIGLYPNGNSVALDGGIPLDYNVSPALAVRVTPDFLYTRFGSSNQYNLGFTAGIVYRFHKR
ncbi:MAG TPA: hypothetical protein VM554_07290 [Acidisarcina sp.]|nr:hypothetical protein [Acidisarcina sp.]